MSTPQKTQLRNIFLDLIMNWKDVQFHHGDCLGADSEAHDIAIELRIGIIIIHPPANPYKRAFCFNRHHNRSAVIQVPEKDYITRNHDIVNETEVLIVAPRTMVEELRSGTWATFRFAKKLGKPYNLLQR